MRLLVIEDDQALIESLKADLSKAGFAVDIANNGLDGEYLGDNEPYDIVILDLGLPHKPGMEILQSWRSRGNAVPVIVLTSRDQWYERVDGFKAGADDYLGKPFHIEELIARIRALVARKHGTVANFIRSASLTLNEDEQRVTLDLGSSRREHALTGTEFRLLRYMMLNRGKVLSKTNLSEHVYDHASDRDSNLIEVYIRRLREKIGNKLILTKRGQGYVFNDPAS